MADDDITDKLFSLQVGQKQMEQLRLFFHTLEIGETVDINAAANPLDLWGLLTGSPKIDDKTKCTPMLQYMLKQVGVGKYTDLGTHDLMPYYKELGYPSVLVKICQALDADLYDRLKSYFCQKYLDNFPTDNVKNRVELFLKLHQANKISETDVGVLISKLQKCNKRLSCVVEHYAKHGEFSETPDREDRLPVEEAQNEPGNPATDDKPPLQEPTSGNAAKDDMPSRVKATDGGVHFTYEYWDILKEVLQRGSGVHIAVLDTGINQDHEAFKWKIKAKRNFFSETPDVDPDPDDCMDRDNEFHGTSVAGVAAGRHVSLSRLPGFKENFNIPESMTKVPLGVAEDASLVICRVARTHGAFSHVAVRNALKWIYEHNVEVEADGKLSDDTHRKQCSLPHDKEEENIIRIVNMSFRLDCDSEGVKEYLVKLKDQGVIGVAGAGNDGENKPPGWPAQYSLEPGMNVITVGSCDRNGKKAAHTTSYGDCSFISVLALGMDLILPTGSTTGFEFRAEAGTSFATPAVGGLLARLLQCARENKFEEDFEMVTNRDKLLKLLDSMGAAKSRERLLSPHDLSVFFEAYKRRNERKERKSFVEVIQELNGH